MNGTANDKSGNTWKTVKFDKNYVRTLYNPGLWVITERFDQVQIENDDAVSVIERYGEGRDTLLYFDPPYVKSERSHKNEYAFEWANTQHIQAADLLRKCAGYVIVSGYACPLLYTELYENYGWTRHDKEAQTNSGGKRIESLWLSPRTVEALGQREQLSF